MSLDDPVSALPPKPTTISGVVDELERIQSELVRVQKALERIEKQQGDRHSKESPEPGT